MIALAHKAMKQWPERRQPLHPLDAGNPARLFFGQLVALPLFHFGIGLAQKQDLALILLMSLRVQQQNRFLLLDAGEIKQVGVRPEHQRAVRIRRQNVIGIQRGQ